MPLSFVQFAPYSQLSTFRFLSGRARRSEVSVAVPALSYLVMLVFSPRDVIRLFAPASFLSVSLPLLFLFWGVLIPPHLDGFCTPRLPLPSCCMFACSIVVLRSFRTIHPLRPFLLNRGVLCCLAGLTNVVLRHRKSLMALLKSLFKY